ncbi:MAG: helix-turn-helix transcriptional regulator [Acidaminococcaceae bacterium]|jgi:transcriptional regulator with XRE-family HTH domain|nr:helix-turn-helix transcriptional regulator [Acidaminococcaceae bacterium]
MTTNFSSKVGTKIRTYRKARKISLSELSVQINKSKGTISKYEAGSIAIDIMTLYEIALFLQVDIAKLVEYVDNEPISSPKIFDNKLPSILYMYHSHHQKYYTSIINLGIKQENGNIATTLYYKIADLEANDIKCTNIYHGSLISSATHLNFSLANFHNKADILYLLFHIPMEITEAYPGMLLGLQNSNMRPASTKVLLSHNLLGKSCLERNLKFSHKDWRKLKTGSYFTINELL